MGSTADAAAGRIILFDGACRLCVGAVQFIIRHDPEGSFKFASIQTENGRRLYEQYGCDPAAMRTLLLIKNGVAYARSDAAIEIAKDLGGAWRLLACLKWAPRPVRNFVYDRLAQCRHRLFGGAAACMAAGDEMRGRFLE